MKHVATWIIITLLVSLNWGKELEGPIKGKLKKSGSPYHVTKEISVLPKTSLTIEPGVIIKFDTTAVFTIDGKLTAIGTKNEQIKFTSSQLKPNGAAWEGIKFTNRGNDNSRLEYCTIEYARHGISIFSVSPTIANNTITYCKDNGILISVSNSHITKNTIKLNSKDGINAKQFNGKIEKNNISENAGDGIHLEHSKCYVAGNIITLNEDDGIFCYKGNATIENNRFIKNGDDGILLGNSSSIIFNNLIAKSNFGIFIYEKSLPTIVNCTIVNNKYGLFARDNSKLNVENSIIWNNEELSLVDSTSSVKIIYSDTEPEFEGEGNFSKPPKFINTEDFNIKNDSPCIGKGTPTPSYNKNYVIKTNIGAQLK